MRFLFILLFIALSACARKNYADPKELAQNNQQQSADCALEFTKVDLCASISWTQGPQTPQQSEFILHIWNKKNANVNGPYQDPTQNLSVVLWMPSMGHGSAPVKIEKLQDGVFRVSNVYFIMAGDWEIRVFLKDSASTVDQATEKLVL